MHNNNIDARPGTGRSLADLLTPLLGKRAAWNLAARFSTVQSLANASMLDLIGAGLATVKGVILIYLVIVIVTFFLPAKTPLIAKSRLAPLIIASYQSMVRLVSPDHYKNWKTKIMGKKEKMSDIVSEKIEDLTK